MRGDHYELNELDSALIGVRTGRRLGFGDPVEVRVESLEPARGRVTLEPGGAESSERTGGSRGPRGRSRSGARPKGQTRGKGKPKGSSRPGSSAGSGTGEGKREDRAPSKSKTKGKGKSKGRGKAGGKDKGKPQRARNKQGSTRGGQGR